MSRFKHIGNAESIKSGVYPQRYCLVIENEQSSSSQSHLEILNKISVINTTDDSISSQYPALQEDQVAQPDEELYSKEKVNSRSVPGSQEVWCVSHWYYFKKTGHQRPIIWV